MIIDLYTELNNINPGFTITAGGTWTSLYPTNGDDPGSNFNSGAGELDTQNPSPLAVGRYHFQYDVTCTGGSDSAVLIVDFDGSSPTYDLHSSPQEITISDASPSHSDTYNNLCCDSETITPNGGCGPNHSGGVPPEYNDYDGPDVWFKIIGGVIATSISGTLIATGTSSGPNNVQLQNIYFQLYKEEVDSCGVLGSTYLGGISTTGNSAGTTLTIQQDDVYYLRIGSTDPGTTGDFDLEYNI